MRPIVGTLLPPNTPAALPHGLDRGGIFEADYVSPQYIDAHRQTIPTDSPVTENVTTDVFMQKIAFKRPDQVRMITKRPMQGYGQLPTVVYPFGQLPTVVHPFGQPPGHKRFYTSYEQQHRHTVDLPARTALQEGHYHEWGGALPTYVPPSPPREFPRPARRRMRALRGYGQMVQGMGPQSGYMLQSADRPPQPIHDWSPVPRPHGDIEGGIFGRGAVTNGMATGGSVPGVPTKEIMAVRQITGYGAGPDGIGST